MADTPENVTGNDGTPPAAGKERVFVIQIDKDTFRLTDPTPTGRQLLTLAGKVPPEKYALYLKVKGSQPLRIGLDQTVDLREPGVEKFVTLPLDQTEGGR